MLRIVVLVTGLLVIALTVLPLLRAKAWWVRVWDFPRLQLAAVGSAALAGALLVPLTDDTLPRRLFEIALGAAVCFQATFIWRYSRLAPLEVQASKANDPARQLAVAVSNVLESNRDSERLLRVMRAADADVLLFVETDDWWRERLDVLLETHPHTLQCPIANTYGMLLYSCLPLLDTSIDFLIEDDIPSMQARVQLRNGQLVWLNCVHPRPPAPGENEESTERDAELLVVGKRVCKAEQPVVVCGDLNDVAWSHTTRLFQKTSRLVDPRKGRGLFSTFHARIPFLRFPLDHILHSDSFRAVRMARLDYVGSDHFPVLAVLSHEPDAAREQDAPAADGDDLQEAQETIAKA